MTEKVKLSWLNKGEPFEIKKMPLGGQEEVLIFKSENGTLSEEDIKSEDPKVRAIVQKYILQLNKIISKWIIMRCFPELTETDIKRGLERETTYDELIDLAIKANKGEEDVEINRPKNEEEKK